MKYYISTQPDQIINPSLFLRFRKNNLGCFIVKAITIICLAVVINNLIRRGDWIQFLEIFVLSISIAIICLYLTDMPIQKKDAPVLGEYGLISHGKFNIYMIWFLLLFFMFYLVFNIQL